MNIYITFKDLPASKIALEKWEAAKQTYELALKAINQELKEAENKFISERTEKRKTAKFEFSVLTIINEYSTHYNITRKIVNPLEGDTDFNKDINYQSFKIVNNVFIVTGTGYTLPIKSGDILTDEEINELQSDIVPRKLMSFPTFNENSIYYLGS